MTLLCKAMNWLKNRLVINNRLAQGLMAFFALIVISFSSFATSQANNIGYALPSHTQTNDSINANLSNASLKLTENTSNLHTLSSFTHIKKLRQQKGIVARSCRKKNADSNIILTAINDHFSPSNLSTNDDKSFYIVLLALPLYSLSSPRGPPSSKNQHQA